MSTPAQLSDRYTLGEIVGFGGMSEVHIARDELLDRDVAVKVLRADLARDPSFYLRFRREAQNAAALNHPAIVAVYDTGEATTDTGPLPFIVMEYVEGQTLRDVLRSEGPLPPQRAMAVVADVAAALDFSHKNKIVHRDMKPANVMISNSGAVKVMDFGIARLITDATSTMTQTAAVMGTAQYLSPEQARGDRVDARSDVYSLGCVLYEILTGEPPFTGDSPVAVAYQHVKEDPPLPSDINKSLPRELDSVVLKAMSKNPANRYQSAADMRSDLIRVLNGQRPDAPMVMNAEDQTTLMGAVDTTPAATKTPQAFRTPISERLWRLAKPLAMLLVAIGLIVGVGTWLSNRSTVTTDDVSVPNVVGKAREEAIDILLQASFPARIEFESSRTIEKDSVIRTLPVADSSTVRGSTITIVVSKGPDSALVPELVGLNESDARKSIEELSLAVGEVKKAPSKPEDLDKVIAQSPAKASVLEVGSAVNFTIGSGPEEVRVPDVARQRVEVARANLEAAGFAVVVEDVPTTVDASPGTVIESVPSGGSNAKKGAPVTLRVANNNFVMPSLIGMTPGEARGALRAAGSTGEMGVTPEGTLDQGALGRVTGQLQPPGTQLRRDEPISVRVGSLIPIPR